MPTRILITGANGLLGAHLINTLKEGYQLYGSDIDKMSIVDSTVPYRQLDITDQGALKNTFKEIRPEIVINCASYTDVDGCEKYPEKARQINALAVKEIAKLCKEWDSKLVHFSTDYVFDGKSGPYQEEAAVNPINLYGKTKLESENYIVLSECSYLTLRINVLFGNGPRQQASFVNWVVSELKKGNSIRVVDDQYNNPTWAGSLSDCVKLCIRKRLKGLYHFGGKDYLNRLEFARIIADVYDLDKNLIRACKTADLKQTALRPLLGGLRTEKIEKKLNIQPVSVEDALREMKKENG